MEFSNFYDFQGILEGQRECDQEVNGLLGIRTESMTYIFTDSRDIVVLTCWKLTQFSAIKEVSLAA